MADFIFVNFVLVPGEVITNGSPIRIGDGIVTQQGSAIVRNNDTELNLTQAGFYLVNYSVSNFTPGNTRIETIINLRNTNLNETLAIGPSSTVSGDTVATAASTEILQAFSGINNIFKVLNHSNNNLTEGARINLTIFKIA
ncbi:hypothetical protein E0485_00565 [Paenibacillus albiflavus]|uniref:BclA C-terminal domain-containing protein n=1 Tax=Paenibacillus albiflavus TaxID=2545760 RepID=A0A4R4EQF2_9BACL|nr:hypothetical protein [Paenibacillus albiflavus]TCZ80821.1 hypothetical protein E0485_00565 [Paenibacillus albiflavus]